MSSKPQDSPTDGAESTGLQKVVRGFGGLAASSLLSQLVGFGALVFVARRTGAGNLGAYTFALFLANYFNLFCSLGIDYLATRDIAQDRAAASSAITETLILQVALSTIVYFGLVVLSPLLAPNHEARHLVPIVGLILFTSSFTVDWALLALGRSGYVALWRLVGQVVYAALVPVLVISGESGIRHYAWLNVLGLALTALGLVWSLSRVAALRPHLSSARALLIRLRRSLPFSYSLVMIQIYGTIATLMLGYLDSTRAVGIYAVASKLPVALNALANVWLAVFFPHTAQRLIQDSRGFAHELGQIVTATLVIGAALATGAFLCSGTLMPTLFGVAFRASGLPFGLLSCAAALVLLQASFSNVLLAGGSQRYFAVSMTIAAAGIVVLNLLLIPALGAEGAALATLIGEAGFTTITFVGVRRRIGPIPVDGKRVLRGAAVVLVMAAAMVGTRSVGGSLAQIAVGVPAFILGSWVFGAFDRSLFAQRSA